MLRQWQSKVRLEGSPTGSGPAQQAYTLAEVLVATLLLSTLLVSLYAGMSGGLAYTAMVREELRATQVMLERKSVV